MEIGFTGSRFGMTDEQKGQVERLLQQYKPDAVRHGDCLGADDTFDQIARKNEIPVIVHPPTNPKLQAFCGSSSENLPSKPYLERNRDIVNGSDLLIATPKGFVEESRSGTWWTIKYAVSVGCPVTIIWPDGQTEDR